MRKNEKGFGMVEVLLIIVIAALIGVVGFMIYRNQHKAKTPSVATSQTTTTQATKTITAAPTDSNTGYLVVKEWGLRFKVPTGLADVQYKIFNKTSGYDDQLAIYAKPTGSTVEYIQDYESTYAGNPNHALGVLYRSTNPTEDKLDYTVTGKKLGNYYYYTAWAFNSMATGASCAGLYGTSDSDCQTESTAFQLINQGDTALLNTIELAQ